MKKFSPSLIILLAAVIIILLFKSQVFRLSSSDEINRTHKIELTQLALKSLKSNDVPVSSILLYNNKIIGSGFNTVYKDTSAGGHAEINAISDAIKKYGFNEFLNLNRDSLILISTFEPCPMCIGAIQEYKIKQVKFLKEKTITHWLKRELGDLLYEIKKQKIEPGSLQDSLFRLHPGYVEE